MLLAVRKPAEIKGVYSDQKQIEKLRKQYSSKGLSARSFPKAEEQAALKWASVSGIADAKQQVVPLQVNTADKLSPKTKSIQSVLANYANEGFNYACLKLTTGDEILISLTDLFFFRCTNIEYYLYSRHYNAEGEYVYGFSETELNRYREFVVTLKKTIIKYNETGFYLENYGEVIYKEGNWERNPSVAHDKYKTYIFSDYVGMIEPINYTHKNLIDEEDIIKACKKMNK